MVQRDQLPLIKKKIEYSSEENQSGAVAKSHMRKPFLIYEEMRKYFPNYEEALAIYRVAAIFPEHFQSFTVAAKNHISY
jgi:hypothetical protein